MTENSAVFVKSIHMHLSSAFHGENQCHLSVHSQKILFGGAWFPCSSFVKSSEEDDLNSYFSDLCSSSKPCLRSGL